VDPGSGLSDLRDLCVCPVVGGDDVRVQPAALPTLEPCSRAHERLHLGVDVPSHPLFSYVPRETPPST
jgi:hypothetical protein